NEVNEGNLNIENIDETIFSSYLYTKNISEPDLLIRTSGEVRLSNFLLWQLAYTELWFTDVLWPDFNEDMFKEALKDYQTRKKGYGGISGGHKMKARIITAIIGLIIVLPIIIYGNLPFIIVAFILALIGLFELIRMYKPNQIFVYMLFSVLFLIGLIYPLDTIQFFEISLSK